MSQEFKLSPPEDGAASHHERGGARAGAGRPGRPPGRLNKRTEINWRRAEIEWPSIYAGIIMRAKRVADPHRTPTKEEYACAFWLGARLFPEPKAPPIQIDVSQNVDARQLLAAFADGQLSAGETATLMRAIEATPQIAAPKVPSVDARELLGDRLARIVEARQAAEPADRAGATETPANFSPIGEKVQTAESDIDVDEIKRTVAQMVRDIVEGQQ